MDLLKIGKQSTSKRTRKIPKNTFSFEKLSLNIEDDLPMDMIDRFPVPNTKFCIEKLEGMFEADKIQ
jgi:hypothetical protein